MHTELIDNLQQLSSEENFKLDSSNEGVVAGVQRGGGSGKAFKRGLQREMQLMEGRSVFVAMKWLICMHDILQQCQQPYSIELVQQLLPNFKLPKPTDSF